MLPDISTPTVFETIIYIIFFIDNTDKGQSVGGGRTGSPQQLEVLTTLHRFLATMHHHQQRQQTSGSSPSPGAAAVRAVSVDVLATVLADDTPTTTVRAVLTEMTKVLGGAAVMGLLVQLQLPRSAPIFRLVSRISR